MSKIDDVCTALEKNLEILRPQKGKEAIRPEKGYFFKTLNDSIVFVTNIDEDGDGEVITLVGGHGIGTLQGERPGEKYTVNKRGWFENGSNVNVGIVMSLARKLPVDIDSFK